MQCEEVGAFVKCGDFLLANVIQDCPELDVSNCYTDGSTYYCPFGRARRTARGYRVYAKRLLSGCSVRTIMAKYLRQCCLDMEKTIPDDDRNLAGTVEIDGIRMRVYYSSCVVMVFIKSLDDLAKVEKWLQENCKK
ncbi:MAG: hypothetical protein QXU93_07965 [Thermoproteus sp.]